MIAFGPVPSRRLGKSLGMNNIPKRICSYYVYKGGIEVKFYRKR